MLHVAADGGDEGLRELWAAEGSPAPRLWLELLGQKGGPRKCLFRADGTDVLWLLMSPDQYYRRGWSPGAVRTVAGRRDRAPPAARGLTWPSR